MLLGGDRAHSELSNGGFELKIGPFLTEIQPLYINGHNSAKNSPIFNPKPPLESSGPALDI